MNRSHYQIAYSRVFLISTAQATTARRYDGYRQLLASEDSDDVTRTTVFVDGGLLWNYQKQ
jgi:hypothetical protein